MIEIPTVVYSLGGAAITAAVGTLIRLLVRQGRIEERLTDVESDLQSLEEMMPSIWKAINKVDLTVSRVDERQISTSHAIIDHLNTIVFELQGNKKG